MSRSVAEKAVALLWFLWAILHLVPGFLAMRDALRGSISSIERLSPESDSSALTRAYPVEVEAILVTFGQHGFNLFWFGAVALVGSYLIAFRRSRAALWSTAVVIVLADLGALFAVVLIGHIDPIGISIFSSVALGVALTCWLLISEPRKSRVLD
ncbi:MAG: hypothetical protein AAF726_08695 [Planctomycetota bacterium]